MQWSWFKYLEKLHEMFPFLILGTEIYNSVKHLHAGKCQEMGFNCPLRPNKCKICLPSVSLLKTHIQEEKKKCIEAAR